MATLFLLLCLSGLPQQVLVTAGHGSGPWAFQHLQVLTVCLPGFGPEESWLTLEVVSCLASSPQKRQVASPLHLFVGLTFPMC